MWILDQNAPISHQMSTITYKLLNVLDFQANDTFAFQKVLMICVDTLIHIQDAMMTSPSDEFLHQSILLMRICSNIIARENENANYFIENWFSSKNRSISLFFNQFIEFIQSKGLSIQEIYWFIGNIINCSLNDNCHQYLENDEFFTKLIMENQ